MPWVWADGLQLRHDDPTSPCSLTSLDFSSSEEVPLASSAFRFGEADNPGPVDCHDDDEGLPPLSSSCVRVGCSNACGLRGKESMALQLGSGIWCFSETHLTTVLQRTVANTLTGLGRQLHRQVRAHFGAPVCFRSNSMQAGTWSGVGILSDFPSREITLSWKNGERSSGRLMVTRHLVNNMPFLVAACYGFPAGPTWPDSKRLTNQLVATLSQDLVVGGTGPRIIAGDFNCTSQQLDEFKLWESYGWCEVQQHAHHCWQQPMVPTCKGSTIVDMMWMSPEAARMCTYVGHTQLFTDHVTLFADFAVPQKITNILTWPRPTSIQWDKINQETWHYNLGRSPAPEEVASSSTQFFSEWAHHWETALDGCVQDQPNGHLPHTFRGRARRTQPLKASLTSPVSKPSRQGEVQLRSDFVSAQVQLWFKQLRRLQSYKHAAIANKQTLDAEVYRLNLWTAIKKGRGFDGFFNEWWLRRRKRSPAAPDSLPHAPPDGFIAEQIFLDFKQNFEAFEQWHCRQRRKLLQLKYDQSCHRLFHELRPPQARPIGSSLAHQRLHNLGGGPGLASDSCGPTSTRPHWVCLVYQQHAGGS